LNYQGFQSKVFFSSILFFSFNIITESANSSSKQALFNTRKEAEEAAKEYGCKGAHKMGSKWMPCSMHIHHKHN